MLNLWRLLLMSPCVVQIALPNGKSYYPLHAALLNRNAELEKLLADAGVGSAGGNYSNSSRGGGSGLQDTTAAGLMPTGACSSIALYGLQLCCLNAVLLDLWECESVGVGGSM